MNETYLSIIIGVILGNILGSIIVFIIGYLTLKIYFKILDKKELQDALQQAKLGRWVANVIGHPKNTKIGIK